MTKSDRDTLSKNVNMTPVTIAQISVLLTQHWVTPTFLSFDFISVQHEEIHNHMPDEFQTRRGIILKQMHRRIESDPTLPVIRIYDEVIFIDSDDSDEVVPPFENVRSRLKRYRSRFMPPIPPSMADVNIQNEWKKTWKGKKFLILQDNNLGVAVFVTKKMIKTLLDCTCLYIDDTFKTSPHPFKQMVTVHGLSNGYVIPLTFCLLTGKTVLHYRTLLSHIKALVLRKTGQVLAPTKIVIDFEASLRSAVLAEFPQTIVSGCFFHYCSSLWREVQKLGSFCSIQTGCFLEEKYQNDYGDCLHPSCSCQI